MNRLAWIVGPVSMGIAASFVLSACAGTNEGAAPSDVPDAVQICSWLREVKSAALAGADDPAKIAADAGKLAAGGAALAPPQADVLLSLSNVIVLLNAIKGVPATPAGASKIRSFSGDVSQQIDETLLQMNRTYALEQGRSPCAGLKLPLKPKATPPPDRGQPTP